MKPTSKKERIQQMFDSKDWIRGTKLFSSNDFKKFDLSPVNDAGYANQVISKMGFKSSVGMGLFVEKEKS